MKRSLTTAGGTLAALALLGGFSSQATAVQLKDIKVNGIPYTAGMTAPAADNLRLSGTIVTESQDDWYNMALSQNEPYDGFGFFAAGTSPCTVPSPQGLTTTDDPNSQITWPEPSRCIPTFSIAAKIDTNVSTNIFSLNLKFDQKTGAFSNISVPVSSVSGNASFVVTYQLNHWMWGSDSVQGPDPYHRDIDSLASLRYNTGVNQVFRPQATLSFSQPAACGSSAQSGVTVNGPLAAQSLRVNLTPACSEQGSSGKYWVAASIPGQGLFLLQADGSWQAYSSNSAMENQPAATGNFTSRIFSLAEGANLSSLVGTEIWAGYASDVSTLLSTGKASKVYTIK